MSGVGNLIRHLERERKALGLTKEELSSRAGYSAGSWYEAVRGHHVPSAACLNDFAQVLGFKLMLWRDGVKK